MNWRERSLIFGMCMFCGAAVVVLGFAFWMLWRESSLAAIVFACALIGGGAIGAGMPGMESPPVAPSPPPSPPSLADLEFGG